MTKPFLVCCDCQYEIKNEKELVAGSTDLHDKHCPQCGSSTFACGNCTYGISRMKCIDGQVTWMCQEGCNP